MRRQQHAQTRLTKVATGKRHGRFHRRSGTTARDAREHRRQLERERLLERRPAALEHAHQQAIGAARAQAQAQRRGRRPHRRRGFAQHERRAVVVVRGELQPAQPLGPQARRQPGQHRAHMAALERLLERPQAVAAGHHAGPRVDDEQLADIEAQLGERRGRERRRWIEQHHRPAGPLRCHQRRREQAHLADARMRQKQLAQHPPRPAAPGELRVERGETGGHDLAAAAAELVAEPEGGVQCE